MKLLALDTATPQCTLALGVDECVYEDNQVLTSPRHGDILLHSLETLLNKAGCTLKDLEGIACGVGPGSFTGLRLALSAAQGLSLANETPLIGISTLAILAQEAQERFHVKEVVTAIDARMGQLYWQIFHLDENAGIMVASNSPQLSTPEEMCKLLPEKLAAFGNGFKVYPEIDIKVLNLAPSEEQFPQAKYLLSLAKSLLKQGGDFTPDKIVPIYVRDKVTNEKKS